MLTTIIRARILILLFTVFATETISAETPEKYKAAANEKGCMAIPFSSAQSTCISEQSDAKLWCEGKGAMSCEELRTQGLIDQIKNLDVAIKKATDEKKTQELSDLESKKKAAERQIEGNRKEAERRAYNNEQCIQYRVRVQKVFDEAEKRAISQRSLDSNKPSWSDLDKIISELGSGKKGHETQINEAKSRLNFCKNPL